MFFLVSVVCVLFGNALAMYSSKALEGYPAGYLSDCPGSNIPSTMTSQDLKSLSISVQRKGNIFYPKTSYNYYQMKQLAQDPAMDFNKTTMMFVGGYMDLPINPPGLVMGTIYKKMGYTVLLLDTSAFTVTEYPLAVRNIRAAGKHTAEMLANLAKYGLDPQKLWLVGVSLGGQTISFISKNYRLLTGKNISRVTGLDPSGPCFRNLGPEDRLDQSDADFVDVINTNIDGFGSAAPVGHVNFYVNGGEFQPGDFLWAPCNVVCSHVRSYTLWAAALYNPNGFIAMKCNSVQQARDRNCYENDPLITNVVGLNTNRSIQGIFYLATTNNFPYFLGKKGLKREYEFFDAQLNLLKKNNINKVGYLSGF